MKTKPKQDAARCNYRVERRDKGAPDTDWQFCEYADDANDAIQRRNLCRRTHPRASEFRAVEIIVTTEKRVLEF